MSDMVDRSEGPVDDRPVILVVPGAITEAVSATAAAISRQVYIRGGSLVRLTATADGTSEPIAAGRDPALSIRAVDPDWLRYCMAGHARFMREDGRYKAGRKEVDPPPAIVKMLVGAADTMNLRNLRGIVRAPLVRPDGSVVTDPGYDPDTRLYFDFPPARMPAVKERPSREDAAKAVATLKRLLRNFPFGNELDTAVALSAILTAIQRAVLPTAPMHSFELADARNREVEARRDRQHHRDGRSGLGDLDQLEG